ncbi:hypothetical protein JL720_2091 [Aureococcus anophagefferens]|nr:hypothetical protein JL720_2091 [Aureococcus anophagefferens]
MISPDMYLKVFMGSMLMYSVQMMFLPKKLNDDHFAAPLTPTAEFFLRGGSCGYLAMVYCMTKLPTEEALTVAFAEKMKVKYPMHYVPELLMLSLTAAGAYCKFA